MKHVLAASVDRAGQDVIRRCLNPEYQVDFAPNKSSCLELFQKRRYEFTFLDILLLKNSSKEPNYQRELQQFWHIFPGAQIIILCSQDMISEALSAVKAGASNYLTYPLNPDEVRYVIDSIAEYHKVQLELDYLRNRFWQPDSLELVRTQSSAMQEVFDKVQAVAPTETTILLTGETGTGKGVLARLIHGHSQRRNNPFISVHCSAIPETLLESELFGHERGAFTGAFRRKLGKFEIAQGGTLFLDEIGTLSASIQIKLLQVLQEKRFERVGGEETINSDVRIIAATNSDLKKMSDEGMFRTDLYYRLNVFPIEVPPLRDRLEDIPGLTEVFLRRLNKSHPRKIFDIHPEVSEAFQRYSWPGNIRELENLIERAYILENSSVLTPGSFPRELLKNSEAKPKVNVDISRTLDEVRRECLESVERQYLSELLARHKGRIDRSAGVAGVGVRQLHKLLHKYGLNKDDFKRGLPLSSKSEP